MGELPEMKKFVFSFERKEIVCPCGVGHYLDPSLRHGCCGCCSQPDYPGRDPLPGDLAICGGGTLGLITERGRQEVTYPEGKKDSAFVGVHLSSATQPVLSRWSSRRPMVMRATIWDVVNFKKKGKALAMPQVHLRKQVVENWPKRLIYCHPQPLAEFMKWLTENEMSLRDKRNQV